MTECGRQGFSECDNQGAPWLWNIRSGSQALIGRSRLGLECENFRALGELKHGRYGIGDPRNLSMASVPALLKRRVPPYVHLLALSSMSLSSMDPTTTQDTSCLPQLKAGEILVMDLVRDSLVVFLFSPFLYSSEFAAQFFTHPNTKLVYVCRDMESFERPSTPVDSMLVIVTDKQVLWFEGNESGTLSHPRWFQSKFWVIHFFTTGVFGGSEQLARNLFDDYFCALENLPSRFAARPEMPAALVEALRLEMPAPPRAITTPTGSQPAGEGFDGAVGESASAVWERRASAVWERRASTTDFWTALDACADAEDEMPVSRDAMPVSHKASPFVAVPRSSSPKQRPFASKWTSGLATSEPVEDERDDRLGGREPAVVAGQDKDDGAGYTCNPTPPLPPLPARSSDDMAESSRGKKRPVRWQGILGCFSFLSFCDAETGRGRCW